jgi:hypothetical protein
MKSLIKERSSGFELSQETRQEPAHLWHTLERWHPRDSNIQLDKLHTKLRFRNIQHCKYMIEVGRLCQAHHPLSHSDRT